MTIRIPDESISDGILRASAQESKLTWPLDKVTQSTLTRWLNAALESYDFSETTPAYGGTPGGSDTQIQFNDGGSFGGNSNLTFDKSAGGSLNIGTPAPASGNSAGDINVNGASGVGASSNGGNIFATAGDAGTSGSGGSIDITGGGTASGTGGSINIAPGSGSTKAGDVIVGRSTTTTTRTGNFLFIPTSAGAPTGTPTGVSGRVAICYDTTNNALYVYNGAWKSVTLS